MSTRYDSIAEEIEKNDSLYGKSLNILSLANKIGLEVFVDEEYVVEKEMCFELCTSARESIHKEEAQKLFDENMPYHLMLMTPSATEQREWIAYCTVLAYLHKTRQISNGLFMAHMVGNNTLRGDLFYRIAACLLIPHSKLNEWTSAQRNIDNDYSEWTAADIQKAAIHFRVSSFMVEERIHQYSGVMFLLNPKDYRRNKK